MATGTQVTPYSIAQFAARIAAQFPHGWAGGDAMRAGVAAAILRTFAADLNLQNGNFAYALAATRIATALGAALDAVSADFYGAGVMPRLPGESDVAFRARIQAALLEPRVTRPAVIRRLTTLTQIAPTIYESFNAGDIGALDMSYLDFAPGPGRYGVGSESDAWTAFADIPLSPLPSTGLLPYFGYGFGTGLDQPQTTLIGGAQSLQFSYATQAMVDQTINSSIAAGTQLLRQFTVSPQINQVRTTATFDADASLAPADTAINPAYAGVMPAFGLFTELPNWPATLWIERPGVNFVVGTTSPPAAKTRIGCLALGQSWPVTMFSLQPGVQQVAIRPPNFAAGLIPVVSAGWASAAWISAMGGSGFTLNFASPSRNGGNVAVVLMPSGETVNGQGGSASVTAAAQSIGIVPEGAQAAPYGVFAIASWNAAVWVSDQTQYGFTLDFAAPAPASGGTVWWWAEAGM